MYCLLRILAIRPGVVNVCPLQQAEKEPRIRYYAQCDVCAATMFSQYRQVVLLNAERATR
jgi:hypothetical protein